MAGDAGPRRARLDVSQVRESNARGPGRGISTLIGGAIPVIGYVVGDCSLARGSRAWLAGVAFIFCGVFLFLIGSARSFFTGKGGYVASRCWSSARWGTLTYVVGVLFRVS